MKIKTLLIVIALGYNLSATAQNANPNREGSESKNVKNPMHANGFNYISLGAELGPILKDSFMGYRFHYGLPLKVYLGRQKKGRFLIRTGVHYFPVPSSDLLAGLDNIHRLLIPLAVGYRKNIQNWYVEGSLGAGANWSTINFTDPARPSLNSSFREINYGLEFGRQWESLDLGLVMYNTGPIPFNMFYGGAKVSYRLKW